MTNAHIIFSLKRFITLYQSLLKLLLLREIYQHHLHKVKGCSKCLGYYVHLAIVFNITNNAPDEHGSWRKSKSTYRSELSIGSFLENVRHLFRRVLSFILPLHYFMITNFASLFQDTHVFSPL